MGEGRWKGQGGMEKEKLWSECIIKGKINNEKKKNQAWTIISFLEADTIVYPWIRILHTQEGKIN